MMELYGTGIKKKIFTCLFHGISQEHQVKLLEDLILTLSNRQRVALITTFPTVVDSRFYNGIKCYVSSEKEYVRSQKGFSNDSLDWIMSFKSGDIFYDIGANIGTFSLIVSKHFNGKIKVFSFEPTFSTFASLIQNVRVNKFENTMSCFQIALGNSTQIGKFNYQSIEPGSSLHTFMTLKDYKGENYQPVFHHDMMCFALDDFIEIFKLPLPTHIKIDVDGTEPDILKGLSKTLKTGAVKSVLIEIVDTKENDERTASIINSFQNSGFSIEKIFSHNKIQKNVFPKISDYLFINNKNNAIDKKP